ncbi:MAG: ribonuclease P protein component [Bacteroidales bacterium]|nr:ribonuclease P protein component [Bacteroidales bacterium]HOY38481.1 ribonuclease P protein component [Bacteroidales bacterium]HQP05013.1 ribonuclease P protein component [Bacteroidales bacterium]
MTTQEKNDFRLRKSEIISKDTEIKPLFMKGNYFMQSGLKTVFLVTKTDAAGQVKVLFTAPKKNIRLAVNRNRVKRLMREAFRQNKMEICASATENKKDVTIAFIITSSADATWGEIERKIILSLQRICKTIEINPKFNEIQKGKIQ